MNIFQSLQDDILSDAPLSTILRKAKVLAYRLNNQEIKAWVESELNGYVEGEEVPDYRMISVISFGKFANAGLQIGPVAVPTWNLSDDARRFATIAELYGGVRELESLGESSTEIHSPWPADALHALYGKLSYDMGCIAAWRLIPASRIIQVIDTVRNRLLTFTLELAEIYPEEAASDFAHPQRLSEGRILQIFNNYILGEASTLHQGETSTNYDQSGQTAGTQVNAGRDINRNY